jgi:uncharacterized membrane protein YozB (DUF420 family)
VRASHFFYRAGLVSGAIALLCGLIAIPSEFGVTTFVGLNDMAPQIFTVSSVVFICIGLLLWLTAVAMLSRHWSQISQSTKIVSIAGLLIGTFLAAYVFHWLFPKSIEGS